MLNLSSTSDVLQVITSAAATVDVSASWVDLNGTTVTPDRKLTAITTATTTTIVAAPGASTVRNVKCVVLRNKHASLSTLVTLQQYDGTITAQLYKGTLGAGYEVVFFDGAWVMFDPTGATSLGGNALTATALQTARNINGVAFDGTADITITANPTAIPATQASDVTVTGITETKTAGEALVFGDVCYLKSDGKAWKADANAASCYPAVLMATGTISANASGTFLRLGQARQDSWNWTIGGVVYLSTTAGAMTQTKPSATDDVVQVIGICSPNAHTVQFYPSLDIHTVV